MMERMFCVCAFVYQSFSRIGSCHSQGPGVGCLGQRPWRRVGCLELIKRDPASEQSAVGDACLAFPVRKPHHATALASMDEQTRARLTYSEAGCKRSQVLSNSQPCRSTPRNAFLHRSTTSLSQQKAHVSSNDTLVTTANPTTHFEYSGFYGIHIAIREYGYGALLTDCPADVTHEADLATVKEQHKYNITCATTLTRSW
jgi:hypothetical protein